MLPWKHNGYLLIVFTPEKVKVTRVRRSSPQFCNTGFVHSDYEHRQHCFERLQSTCLPANSTRANLIIAITLNITIILILMLALILTLTLTVTLI